MPAADNRNPRAVVHLDHSTAADVVAEIESSAGATQSWTNAADVTLPYALSLASKGWQRACIDDRSLALGLSTHDNALVNEAVAVAHGLQSAALSAVVGA